MNTLVYRVQTNSHIYISIRYIYIKFDVLPNIYLNIVIHICRNDGDIISEIKSDITNNLEVVVAIANGLKRVVSMLSSIQSMSYDQTKTGRKLVIEWETDDPVIPECNHYNNRSSPITMFDGAALEEIIEKMNKAFLKKSEQCDPETDQTCKGSKIHVD